MGDRRNVIILSEREDYGIALYTHWGGSRAEEDVALALKAGESRWDDAGYFARVMFCQMVGLDRNGVTGYGIYPLNERGDSPCEDSPSYDIYIDLDVQKVSIGNDNWTFNEFIDIHLGTSQSV